MKKLVLTALVAVVSLAANAQFWAGGELSFLTGKNTFDGTKTGSGTNFSVTPTIGYTINDTFDVGAMIKFSHANSENNFVSYQGKFIAGNSNAWGIAPFVRYKFANAGDFTFFVDGLVGYTNVHFSGNSDNVNQFTVGIKPGISYAVSDKVSLVAHMGRIGYNYVKVGKSKTNEFETEVIGEGLSFGAYYSF